MIALVLGAGLAVAFGTAVALVVNDEDPDALRRRIEADPVGYVGWLVPPVVLAMGLAAAYSVGRAVPWLGWAVGFGALAAATSTIEPWWAARTIAIPQGWPRAAYTLTRLSTWAWREDRRGGALFAGALAAARRPTRDEAAERWLLRDELPPEAAIRLGEAPLTGTAVVAHGLLAASRGDRARARALLEVAARWFDLPAEAASAAWCWLAGEAAERGSWEEVVAAGRRAAGPEPAALVGAAQRLLGHHDAPEPPELIERTRWAPALAPLVTRALDPEPEGWPPPPDDPLLAAVTWHARARHRPSAVGMAALAWDTALGAAPDEALRAQAVAGLVEIVTAAGVDPRLLGSSLVGREAQAVLWRQAVARLEVAVAAVRDRAGGPAHGDRPAIHEVLGWAATARAFDDADRCAPGVDEARKAYDLVYRAVLPATLAWVQRRGHREVGLAVARWLRHGAAALKRKDALRALDEAAAKLGAG